MKLYDYIYWIDLNCIILKIHSDFELKEEMLKFDLDIIHNGREVVNIYIRNYSDYEMINNTPSLYRERIMETGIYIGHHVGSKVKLYIKDNTHIFLCAEDYNRILWSYIVKYCITIYSLENSMLHLKAGLVELSDCGVMIVGRGGAGKTEMIKFLCSSGARFISNTHVISKQNKAYGVNSRVRIRRGKSEEYKDFSELFNCNMSNYVTTVRKILWINHTVDGSMEISRLSQSEMYYNMKQFAEAIATWELHEDIYDRYESDPQKIASLMEANDKRLKEIIAMTDLYYVNGDIKSKQAGQRLLQVLNG